MRSGKDVVSVAVRPLAGAACIPAYAHEDDAGLDLVAAKTLTVEPGCRATIPCGFAAAIPDGFCGLVMPRSGLAAKHGITVLNAPGLIDSGYRGEIGVVLLNTDKSQAFRIETGMRIAQLVIMEVPPVSLIEVDSLDVTSRNTGGFGSSGV